MTSDTNGQIGARPYQGADAQERVEMLNGVCDELMLRTGCSAVVGEAADLWMHNLNSS